LKKWGIEMTLLNAKEDQAKIVAKIADCKTIEVSREEQDAAMTAVAATEGAIKAADKAGIDISKATKGAVTGAIEAGDEAGTQTSKAVRNALTTSIKGAKDVIKPPRK
jgi:hypothetical protein